MKKYFSPWSNSPSSTGEPRGTGGTDFIKNKKESEILFLKSDVVAALSYWIIQQSKVIPSMLASILKDVDKWLLENELCKPDVTVPDFVLYKTTEHPLWEYIKKMVLSVPSVRNLEERSEEQKNDFIDLMALARNVTNTLERKIF